MKRLAKAMSAFTPGRSTPAAGHDAFALATRGASSGFDGSGARSNRSRALAGGLLGACCLAALMLLAASSALAAPTIGGSGIQNYWGNSEGGNQVVGGKFHGSSPRGIAVNDSTGDIYVADNANNRIQQFDQDGTFIRAWGQDVIVAAGSPPNSNGTGFEICDTTTVPANTPAQCKAGITSASTGGAMSAPAGLAINQATGHVYVSDRTFFRIQQFDASGNFIRAFGRDVIIATGPPPNSNGTGYEICDTTTIPANTPAQCKTGIGTGAGAALGGTLNLPNPTTTNFHADLTIAPQGAPNAGAVLVTDPLSARVQEFSATGVFKRAFGGGVATGGATGTGTVSTASKTITSIATTSKAFVVGQRIAGAGLPADAVISAVAAGSITYEGSANPSVAGSEVALTAPVGAGNVPTNEIQTVTIDATAGTFNLKFDTPNPSSTSQITTANIDLDAPAATVQGALEGLSNIGAGNVEVTGPAGGPYLVEFKGPRFADTNVTQMSVVAGVPPLSGGAAAASVATTQEGASAFEECVTSADCQAGIPGEGDGQFAANAVRSIAEDQLGNIYAVESRYNMAEGTSNFRVQKFTLPLDVVTPEGLFACAALCGTTSEFNNGKDNPEDVAVDGSGFVYVTKAFQAGTSSGALDSSGNPLDPPTVPNFPTQFQQRVLKIDPSTQEVVRVFLSNPGRFNKESPSSPRPVHGTFGLTGLAVSDAGLPLYVVNNPVGGTASSFSRVYRVDEIGGLTASLNASDVSASGATLEATITPASTRLDTFYRFEYSRAGANDWSEFRAPPATSADDVGLNLGNGSDGGESSNCSPNVGQNAAVCHVAQTVSGLERDSTYEFRLVASTEANGLVHTSEPVEFETAPSRPAVVTGTAVWSGPPGTEPSLTFNGQVNPAAAQTRFSFEYGVDGPCSANPCGLAPAFPIDIGHGTVGLDVNATVAQKLDPTKTYHYRIVASNPEGTSFGADRSVLPPNDSDRFVELVSDGDSKGTGVFSLFRLGVSDDGERAIFSALAFGEEESAPSLTRPNIAQRGATGWEVTSMVPSPDARTFYRGDDDSAAFDADVSRVLWADRPSPGSYRWIAKELGGDQTAESSVLTPLQRQGAEQDRFLLRGTSRDQSTIVFANNGSGSSGKAFTPDEQLVTGGAGRFSNLYAISGAGGGSPTLSVVNRGTDGKVLGGACGARLGAMLSGDNSTTEAESTRAVSADGSVVYFSARPGNPATCDFFGEFGNPARLYKRIDDTTTVEVSACAKTLPATCGSSGDDFFSGASENGDRVYFTSPRQLTDTDTDSGSSCSEAAGSTSGCDLYLYDAEADENEELTQVSGGPNANVLGVLDVSMDGSRVYFAAEGLLTGPNGQGDAPEAGKANLYVFQRQPGGPDRLGFVAKLSPRSAVGTADRPDADLWMRKGRAVFGKSAYALPYYDGLGVGRSAGDGHLLIFTSEEKLSSEDADSVRDLYRYDDSVAGGQLKCLTCDKDGAFPVSLYDRRSFLDSASSAISRQRVASEDGSKLVFTTREQLHSDDTNQSNDVYLWEQGDLSLVSGATGSAGVQDGSDGREKEQGAVISPDGSTIFFLTRATILPQDTNNGAWDWYAVRVGGGFKQQATIDDPCRTVGNACQGEDPESPAAVGAISSGQFRGSGNLKNGKPSAGCSAIAKRTRNLSQRAKRLRRQARRAGNPRKAGQLRRQASRVSRQAQKVSRDARRCRQNNNRRAGR